jgi:HEAT repeat protein
MSESKTGREGNLQTGMNTVDSLMKDLASGDGIVRQNARRRLVQMGHAAVPALVEGMQHPRERVRWEAAKALGEIRDPAGAPVLVAALEDEEPAVRWLAATGLIGMGRGALAPLLEALEGHSNTVFMREGAHRVLHALKREGKAAEVQPVLDALENLEPPVEVPVAAYHVLHKIREAEKVEEEE